VCVLCTLSLFAKFHSRQRRLCSSVPLASSSLCPCLSQLHFDLRTMALRPSDQYLAVSALLFYFKIVITRIRPMQTTTKSLPLFVLVACRPRRAPTGLEDKCNSYDYHQVRVPRVAGDPQQNSKTSVTVFCSVQQSRRLVNRLTHWPMGRY